VPKVLVAALSDVFAPVRVATRFPTDLQQLVESGTGVVRVIRIGGTNRDQHTDQARVAIDVVHASEGNAEDLAESIRTWLTDRGRTIWGAGAMLDKVECDLAPHEVAYTDPSVSQFSMSIVVSARRMETR
jgi:hypothetical protein